MCTLSFRSFEETRGVGRASEVRVPKRGRRVAKGYKKSHRTRLFLIFLNVTTIAARWFGLCAAKPGRRRSNPGRYCHLAMGEERKNSAY